MSRTSAIKEDGSARIFFAFRHYFVLVSLLGLLTALFGRAVYLQLYEKQFLSDQGMQRQIRTIETPAYRGAIMDRLGTPLAISTPVDSVWVNPQEVLQDLDGLKAVTSALGLNYQTTIERLKQRAGKEFVYLKRQLEPDFAAKTAVLADGVYLQREYQRYYPAGEVVSHLVGFTNIDDRGQEGLELVYQDWLKAETGARTVIRNRKGEVIEEIAQVRRAESGQDLYTSIDMRLQYIAYRSLAKAIQYHAATSGSAVLVDVQSGEILAMVNLPSFNPNQQKSLKAEDRRNRALTDVFEPGSAIKPFTIAAAMDRGLYGPDSKIDTSPGWFMVSGHPIKDSRDYGELNLAGVLRKSSNVGASRIAQSMSKEELWESFSDYGFGEPTGISFPAESSGYLRHHTQWQPLDHATVGFGYGLSVSVAQLARAYATIANLGQKLELSLIRMEDESGVENQINRTVMKSSTARNLLKMMEEVVGPEGSAKRAAVSGYRVAGKTGTARKSIAGGYQADNYVAVFAGIAPASRPRLVMAVMVDQPKQNGYYGGVVAAPVFQEVMSNALRILDIAPDNLTELSRFESLTGEGV
ncbi:MAG: cell division protein FtsI (penicillin-binding protein 3) [Gammaproteobacteria bacterium]|jgi:cell division protein FtsI (penicillin-binding protein 3)